MPYKSEIIPISGTENDRRIRLNDEQRSEIKTLYKEESISTRKLAAMYGVSRRTITFILDPNKASIASEQFKRRRKDGRYKPSKEKRAKVMREHRNHKQALYKQGKLNTSTNENIRENK